MVHALFSLPLTSQNSYSPAIQPSVNASSTANYWTVFHAKCYFVCIIIEAERYWETWKVQICTFLVAPLSILSISTYIFTNSVLWRLTSHFNDFMLYSAAVWWIKKRPRSLLLSVINPSFMRFDGPGTSSQEACVWKMYKYLKCICNQICIMLHS